MSDEPDVKVGLSLSKSALILSPCLRWAWEGAKRYEDEFADTTKRDKGTAFHECMDDYYKSRTWLVPPWEDVNAWVHKAVAWSQQHLEPRLERFWAEKYVAVNFHTGNVYANPDVRHRKYPSTPGYIPGTADIVGFLSSDHLYVADWKTGKGTGAREQLMSLALGFTGLWRMVKKVTLAILYVAEENGRPVVHPVEWDVTLEELEAHRFAMSLQLQDVGVRTEPVTGIQCTQLYCPHLAYCPGVVATSQEAAMSDQLISPEALLRAHSYSIQQAPSSDEHAGSIMERVTAAKRQLDFYQARVRKYAENGGRVIAGDFEYSKGKDGFRWRPKKDK